MTELVHEPATKSPTPEQLRVDYRPTSPAGPNEASEHMLAAVGFGVDAPEAPLNVRVPLPQLGQAQRFEAWHANETPKLDEAQGYQLASTSDLLFGSRETDAENLEECAFELYKDLLEITQTRGMELVRIWNSIPCLHEGPSEFDRYMQFCKGRSRAFEARFGDTFEQRLPACSAVGSQGGPTVVYFLAARKPSQYLENARQVSAYNYPPRYGPRSPSFARASRAPEQAGGWLMISGTASILGHKSAHLGDVREQTLETLRNIRVLVHGEAGISTPLRDHMPSAKVYLRNPGDLPVVREIVEQELGPKSSIVYLEAEVCRSELLVEIEGVAIARNVGGEGQAR